MLPLCACFLYLTSRNEYLESDMSRAAGTVDDIYTQMTAYINFVTHTYTILPEKRIPEVNHR